MTKAIPIQPTNCLFSKNIIPKVLEPFTFRMPISLVRCSVAYKAIPNNPKQVRKILISEYMIINSASSVVLLLRCMNSL